MVSSINGSGSDYISRRGADRQSTGSPRRDDVPVSGNRSNATQTIRTPEDAINVLRARIEQNMGQAFGQSGMSAAKSPAKGFEPPSAADVASRVLGFVQNRLQQEADAGADNDRLAGLLEQARAGIEKGFAEAREQIEALGMMNDKLSADIDDSFGRIQDGLGDLEGRYLGDSSAQSAAAASASSVEASSRDQLAFEVRTRDGDVVTVRMDELRYAAASTASMSNERGSASQSSATSMFAGRYEFSVDGELDEGEREALTALFEDVQSVAGQFFDGDVQAAFQSAKDLNLTGNELASFSLNLSSMRSVSASTYEAVSERPSAATRLRPLEGLAKDIQAMGRDALANGIDGDALSRLMDEIMSDIESRAPASLETGNRDLMDNFWKAIVDSLNDAGGDESES